MTTLEPIAIIGIGCRMPGGVKGPDDLWSLLAGGVDAITEVPADRWNASAMYHPDASRPGRMITRWGGFIDNIDRFDAQFFGITPREAAAADPQQRLLLEVAFEAVEDAGLSLASLSGARAGVHVGTSAYDYGATQFLSPERASIDAYTNLGLAMSVVANRISYFFNLVGPSMVVDTACSSSLVAAHLGCQCIWNGESDLELVAGVNVILRPELAIGFSKASMLAPDGHCKAFDARADGFVRSEGVAVAVLKPLSRALEDGDRIYALIRSSSVNQDGHTNGITVPNAVSQEANIVAALQLANVAPESVQYVEAHGTGTPVGDPLEMTALGAVYGKAQTDGTRCLVGSLKSNLGHMESTSGIAGLVKAALCLYHGQIPPNLHFEQPNPEIPFDDLRLRVPTQLQPWPNTNGQPPRAGVNSFGFGGTNAHAILEAPPKLRASLPAGAKADADPGSDEGRPWLLALSARSESALAALARCYRDAFAKGGSLEQTGLRDVCFSAAARRSHHGFRLTVTGRDKAEMTEQIEAFLNKEQRPNMAYGGRADDEPPKPVFVCSGMGQQWWAMGRELMAREPVYRQAVEDICARFAELSGWSLLDELVADEAKSRVQETQIGQPAIFAVQVGLAALWRSWGVEPAAVIGHSAGELAASLISGALSVEDAVEVAYHRSSLQRRLAGEGTMLAAGISRAEALQLVERHPDAISIAAINGPGSVTLSGDAAVLTEIDNTLNEAGLFCRILQVEVPFHSPKMEELREDIIGALSNIRPQSASTPFFSTVTGTELAGPELDAHYWYRNIREPVLFSDTMAALIKQGHHVFLELGAHPILRRDIGECLKEHSVQGIALGSLRREEPEQAALLGNLGRMYVAGTELDWRKLFPAESIAVKLPLYPFQREIYWREAEQVRHMRLGNVEHPLLGHRYEAPQPCWNLNLDISDLGYLTDHRISNSIVFPGAGYVEMALAAAKEIFGPVSCVVEDVELEKFLVLKEKEAQPVQVTLDTASHEFGVYARTDDADSGWELHARGYVRQYDRPRPTPIGISEIRQRCRETGDSKEMFQQLTEMGIHHGPTFQGIQNIWRGNREALVEIRSAPELDAGLAEYRLHPAVLDSCFKSVFAAVPTNLSKREAFVPVKIERLRFYASPSNRLFAHGQLKELGPSEIKANIVILDEDGNCLVEISGFICRPAGLIAQATRGSVYEYQWKPKARTVHAGSRDSRHIPAPATLASEIEREAEGLWQRFDRIRFQDEIRLLSRQATAAYIVEALRELGWSPEMAAGETVDTLADKLGIVPRYRRWLNLMLKELTPQETVATVEADELWRRLSQQFPEYHAEITLLRICGENLPAVLRGEIDPLNLLFPEGALTNLEALYLDSPTMRLNNLLMQRVLREVVAGLPRGRALRILEIGGGTGGATSGLLPALPEHCTEYVFTDVTPMFMAHAQHRFAQYPFVQFRTLDLDHDPVEQGFEAHSFDVIVASDVLHATRDLRKSLSYVKELLGSGGMLMLLEPTNPWLAVTLTFGLLDGWWVFEDHDIRPDEPCVAADTWRSLLIAAGFDSAVCIADCPDRDLAPHSVILARGQDLPATAEFKSADEPSSRTWLLFADAGQHERPSTAVQLGDELGRRGDRIIQVTRGTAFQREKDGAAFVIRVDHAEDFQRLIAEVGAEAPPLAGIAYFWNLDAETSETLAHDGLIESGRLGCIGAMYLVQALTNANGFAADGVWLVNRAAQPLVGRDGTLQVMQSPLWGFGRVALAEYQNLHCRLVDLATGSREELRMLADEMIDPEPAEDEIALHGELRYLRRLVPVSPASAYGMGPSPKSADAPFRIELLRPGIVDSLTACSITRRPPGPGEIEIEIAATGLNFRDLMLTMGLMPREAVASDPYGTLLGSECAGHIVAVGEGVTEFAVGDEVVALGSGTFASHIIVDARFVARKPSHMTQEAAATTAVTFFTASYSIHTLGQLRQGERILIHSGASGVGLAAVQLALRAGAEVFATAGSPEKRALLTSMGVPHVMDSRTLAFADEIMERTGGEGVDLVLNSLAGEAVDKSLSVLRSCGRFVEIGKVDIYNNRKMGMGPLRKNISLFAVDLIGVGRDRPDFAATLMRELFERFERKELHPLPHRVFSATRVKDAFRVMAQAKHIGKLIVSMRDRVGLRVEDAPQPIAIESEPSYLITGGLGGLGLALADGLARRGARHLALVGRSTPSPSAQEAVEALRRRGVEVMICQADVADREQVRNVIQRVVHQMGPLRGLFHGAMVLDDAPIDRLTEERMWKTMAPKMLGAWNLHVLTRDCPLDFFVSFSSFASIVGSKGQANYVAGNAFLDVLPYYRRAQGLPGLTVNWGMVGEVGYVAQNLEVAQWFDRLGIKPLSVAETLDILDQLMAGPAVQVGVGRVDWKGISRVLPARLPGRFSGLVSEAGGDGDESAGTSRVREIMEADAAALPALLEGYLRDVFARAMQASPSQIDTRQSLLNLGLDSLIAVEVRSRIGEDLGVNIPMAKFKQGASIEALIAHIGELLTSREGGDASAGIDANGTSDAPRLDTGDYPADLLERVDQMSDEEVERRLSELTAQG